MMTRKPVFWAVFAILFAGSIFFWTQNYNKAFPVVSLDIRMNREMAMSAAADLGDKYNWHPREYRTAVTFYSERNVQTFVELEGGGLETFKSLSADSLYFPYGWQVRHFQENNPNETSVWFTPAGDPYCFRQKLGEDEPGAALGRDSALAVALAGLRDEWAVDLESYELVDEAEKTQPGGRVDHTFTYQRSGFELGENGFLRLRLVVSGDILTELMHFFQVPEAFQRRFSEMRSANDKIAFSSVLAMVLLYGLGGCVLGVFFLMRQRRVLWKTALLWGSFVSFVQVVSQINFLPLMWMNYDTAIATGSFITQIIISSIVGFLLQAVMYTLSFIAAESLSRRAFPNHIQFWKLWSPDTVGSTSILGQTIGGFMMAGLFLAYSLIFYMFTQNNLGWWSPADTDYNPNILAAYFPWLTSIAISLGAGFWEECLFRAVPIAGAALIGDRYGKRNLFIGVAMVVQALVFGAGHANYPVQPAYARVIELIIPSLAFGFLYLRFGLLVGIVMHYAIDVAFISLPLFVADVPGIWVNRMFVILLLLVPLWVIIYRRVKAGRWVNQLENVYNQHWLPPAEPVDNNIQDDVIEPVKQDSILAVDKVLMGFAATGLVLWISLTPFQANVPAMEISRADAEEIAAKTFAELGVIPDSGWTVMSRVLSGKSQDDRFIWQTAGPDIFSKLIGNYLEEPAWFVRYRMFEGDVAARAEEYMCWINSKGETYRTAHRLPEDRAGAAISEDEARSIALGVLKDKYALNTDSLVELESVSSKKPNRLDWEFKYQDTTMVDLEQGELRLWVKLVGDEVGDYQKMVHVPEEWERAEKEKNAKRTPVTVSMILVVVLSLLACLVLGVIRWSNKQFNKALFLKALVGIIAISVLGSLNEIPTMVWHFSTSKPWNDQVFQEIGSTALFILFIGLFYAVMAGATHNLVHTKIYLNGDKNPLKGLYIGLFLAGLLALVNTFFPSRGPLFGSWGALAMQVPVLHEIISPLGDFIILTLIVLVAVIGISALTKNWSMRRELAAAYIVILGLAKVSGNGSALEVLSLWLACGVVLGAVFIMIYRDLLRMNPAIIPITTGTLVVLGLLENGLLGLHPSALIGSLLGCAAVSAVAYIWYLELLKAPKEKAAG